MNRALTAAREWVEGGLFWALVVGAVTLVAVAFLAFALIGAIALASALGSAVGYTGVETQDGTPGDISALDQHRAEVLARAYQRGLYVDLPGPVPNVRVGTPQPEDAPDPTPDQRPGPIVVDPDELGALNACNDDDDCQEAMRQKCDGLNPLTGLKRGGVKKLKFDATSTEPCEVDCWDGSAFTVDCRGRRPGITKQKA